MARNYSRLASVEERRNLRRAITYIVLAISGLVLLFFLGIPVIGRFTAFVSDLGKSNKPITNTDKTPPAPPRFNTFPDFTNQNQISLAGTTESGTTIKLTFNRNVIDTLADKDGTFTFSNLTLNDGYNIFFATSTDAAGNNSQQTQEYKIVFDNKPPDLTIESPGDGSTFFGSKQRQITIQGISESGVQITINDRVVVVDDNGKFQYTLTLNEGENKFTIKATDQAGNSIEKDLMLSFSP
ncbi:MAG: hypothetical protein UT58_C0004G0045 [Microgenomates group bacterium GW2011_GWC1_39_7b]|nr:MAG: hypothetical protein UT58_C0004G0045 [Microgenomates group bacterium GW2011_GWC1_39_7b]KKS90705.1 MAG: hypothetical protein UV66_C0001G0062 [Candidatus Woesebacteria bacterium GW2011_GWA1_43_12]